MCSYTSMAIKILQRKTIERKKKQQGANLRVKSNQMSSVKREKTQVGKSAYEVMQLMKIY